jgi:hypothetical protein
MEYLTSINAFPERLTKLVN